MRPADPNLAHPAELDRLAAALAALLAGWWRRHADQEKAAPGQGAADAGTSEHAHAAPEFPTTSGRAASRHPLRRAGR